MPNCEAVKKSPALTGDFSLVPIGERLQWRDALSRHLLGKMTTLSGYPLSEWKIDEQVVPMNLAIAGLLEQGISDPQAIEDHFESDVNRNDYATSK